MEKIKQFRRNIFESFFSGIGFDIDNRDDSGISFIKRVGDIYKSISIPYKIAKDHIFLGTPVASIGIPYFEELVVDLCYEAIAREKDFKMTSKWKDEAISEATTILYVQAESPSGRIMSKFQNYTVENHFNKVFEGFVNDFSEYIEYLKKYNEESLVPFYESVKNINALDKLTDGLDIFHLSLYLTGIPSLKKIILMHLTNNSDREVFFEEYKKRLEPHKTTPNVAPIYASLIKIKDYFANHPDKTI